MRRKTGSRAVVILMLVPALLLGACDADEGSAAALEGPTWTLESFSLDGPGQPVPEGVEATATFANGTVQGNSGCNSFSGRYELSGVALTFGPLASTMMACDPPQGVVEGAVLAGLEATASFRIEDGALTLLDATGGELLVYV